MNIKAVIKIIDGKNPRIYVSFNEDFASNLISEHESLAKSKSFKEDRIGLDIKSDNKSIDGQDIEQHLKHWNELLPFHFSMVVGA